MLRTYRVAVRGRFADLDDAQRAELRAGLEEHSLWNAAFTPAGTLAYEADLRVFTVRVLVTEEAPTAAECDAAAEATGLIAAGLALAERGLGSSDLRASSTCVEDVMARLRR